MEILKHRPDIKKVGGAIRRSIYPTAALSIATITAGGGMGEHLVKALIANFSQNGQPTYAFPDSQDSYKSSLQQAYTDLISSPSRVLRDGTYIQGTYPNTRDAETKLLQVESNLPLENNKVNTDITYPLLRVSSSFSDSLTTSLARFNSKDVTNETFTSQRTLIKKAESHISDLAKTPDGLAYQRDGVQGKEHALKFGIGAVATLLLAIGTSVAKTKRKS